MIIIPFDNTLDAFTEDVDIDGVSYSLTFWWNFRDLAWYFDIANASGEVLRSGIKIVLSVNLFNGEYGLPSGSLLAVASDPTLARIGKTDLGGVVDLIYATAAEVAAVPAAS